MRNIHIGWAGWFMIWSIFFGMWAIYLSIPYNLTRPDVVIPHPEKISQQKQSPEPRYNNTDIEFPRDFHNVPCPSIFNQSIVTCSKASNKSKDVGLLVQHGGILTLYPESWFYYGNETNIVLVAQ